MQITLAQFEVIDGMMSSLHRMGDFETCSDPRSYIQTSNRLLDACIDAVGYGAACEFPSAEECAAVILSRCLSSATLVMAP